MRYYRHWVSVVVGWGRGVGWYAKSFSCHTQLWLNCCWVDVELGFWQHSIWPFSLYICIFSYAYRSLYRNKRRRKMFYLAVWGERTLQKRKLYLIGTFKYNIAIIFQCLTNKINIDRTRWYLPVSYLNIHSTIIIILSNLLKPL